MREAQDAATSLSTERRHPTGAVVVKNGEIIGKHGNQAGFKHKTFQYWHDKKHICVRYWIGAKSGTLYWICPGCASFSSHGEQMAIKDAQKLGNDTKGADLYLYGHWWCCEPCWNAMTEAGIKDVYLLENSEILFDRDHEENIIRTQFRNFAYEDLLKTLAQIEEEHKEELESKVRYARYIDGESNEEWKELLGPDVSFGGHPHVTVEIAEKFANYDNNINQQEKEQLMVAALIHDMGELTVDGDGVGDISYDQKDERHFGAEGSVFEKVITQIENKEIREYLRDVYKNIARDDTTLLGKAFNAIERVGYIRTGIRAYQGVNGKRISNWQGLTGNVFKNHIIPSIEHSANFHFVAHFLKTEESIITKILDETNWENIPNGADNKPTYELEKVRETQRVWKEYTT